MKNNKKSLSFEIQELDRERIARDLHDTSLQELAHLVHKIELASLYMDKDVIRTKLELASISSNIDSIIEEIRNTIYDLRPMVFDDFGLKEAIEKIFDRVRETSNMILISDIEEISLEDETFRISIFRIIQECINNACKHSHAKKLMVSLKEKEDMIELIIQDDGVGFEVKKASKKERHFGLLIIKERVEAMYGKLEIASAKGKGTKIYISIPR